MGLKNSSLTEAAPEAGLLGAWHANLKNVNRKKCVLFVNDKTLYNFVVINLSRAKIRELDSVFVQYLFLNLFQEGFSEELVKRLTQEYDTVQFAKTDSKSILGSMNDLAFHYKYHIQTEGEDALPSIIHKLNRMPMGAQNYSYSIESLMKHIEKKIG